MKKILHILLISCFSFTITSCTEIIAIGALGGGAYWYKDDISAWYDEFSKESDETEKTDAKLEQTTNSTISEKTPSFRFLFVSAGVVAVAAHGKQIYFLSLTYQKLKGNSINFQ